MSVPADPYPSVSHGGRSARLDRCLAELLGQAPELEAAAVVSFDGLAMASALPAGMDEDRVAAMSAALLSLGEKAAQGLGRGDLSQVYVEGEYGTVFLISAEDEAVLVAVAAKGAKAGLMLYEVRRSAVAVGRVLQEDVEVAYDNVEELFAAPSAGQPPAYPAPTPVPSAPTTSAVFVPGDPAASAVATTPADRAYQTAPVHEAFAPAPQVVPDPETGTAPSPQGVWSPYSGQQPAAWS